MIDTHAHINTDAFAEDREEMIERAREAGVERIVIPAISPADYPALAALADKHGEIFFAAGVHPHNACEFADGTAQAILAAAKHPKCVAIGEAGLDYHYDFAPRDIQKEVFRQQINLAKIIKKPIIVHNRESDEDLIDILEAEQDGSLSAVLHCFTGPASLLQKALDLGFHVSFTGNVTFKNANWLDIVGSVPDDRFMIETDSPYMTPVPFRGKRNEPAHVRFTAEKIAGIKNIPLQELIKMTTETAKRFFNMLAIMLLLALPAYAQQNDDEYYDDEEPIEEEVRKNPYKRGLGIGFFAGPNTLVETQFYRDKERPVSYEGISAFGGYLAYSPFDYLITEVSYAYSKNSKIVEKGVAEFPFVYQIYNLTTHWVANPASKINIFGTLGFSIINTEFGQVSSSKTGMNFGIGFAYNQSLGSAGLLNIVAEWRLDFMFGRQNFEIYDPEINQPPIPLIEIEASQFFSIPRFGVAYYPNLW